MLKAARTVMSALKPPRPIVAVIGTTGVGKSNLAVALAQSLPSLNGSNGRGVVLSADSMQLYKGLDVITNKVTSEEMGGIEHWGLDVVQPGEGGSWELGTWCTEADKKVDATPLSTLPIVCGGTHYFIQHFLFPPTELSLDRNKADRKDTTLRWTPPTECPSVPADMDPELKKLLDTFWTTDAIFPGDVTDAAARDSGTGTSRHISRPVASNDQQLLAIWRVLEAVDPKEAGRWHWRDGRKVRRALERWWERGGGEVKSTEEVLGNDAGSGRRARFRTLIFWVYEPLDALRPRLDMRVDKMVQNGLLKEIEELRGIALRLYGSADAIDHAEGIFQSIGYKEFAALPLPQADPASSPLYPSMLARTKTATHQYAKSQIKWIQKQLIPAAREARAHGGEVYVYVVPGGPPGEPVACDVLRAFLAGEELPNASSVGHKASSELLRTLGAAETKVPDTADRQTLNSRRICDLCSQPGQPYSIRTSEWEEHLRSKIHRRHSKFVSMTREEWIAKQKAEGIARKAERERLRQEGAFSVPPPSSPPSN